jgi:hypothetical protein
MSALRNWSKERNAIYLDDLDLSFATTFEMQLATDFPNKNLVLEVLVMDAWLNDGKGYILASSLELELQQVLLECSVDILSELCKSGECLYADIACLISPNAIQLKPAYVGEYWAESDTCGVISDGFDQILSAKLVEIIDVDELSRRQ